MTKIKVLSGPKPQTTLSFLLIPNISFSINTALVPSGLKDFLLTPVLVVTVLSTVKRLSSLNDKMSLVTRGCRVPCPGNRLVFLLRIVKLRICQRKTGEIPVENLKWGSTNSNFSRGTQKVDLLVNTTDLHVWRSMVSSNCTIWSTILMVLYSVNEVKGWKLKEEVWRREKRRRNERDPEGKVVREAECRVRRKGKKV